MPAAKYDHFHRIIIETPPGDPNFFSQAELALHEIASWEVGLALLHAMQEEA